MGCESPRTPRLFGQEIADEPDWGAGHQQRVGYRNRSDRVPGFSGDGDYHAEIEEAQKVRDELKSGISEGELVNFSDLVEHQTEFHLRHPENKSRGWRYVLNATEDWVKGQQGWPINVKRGKKQDKEKVKEQQGGNDSTDGAQQEHEWWRGSDDDKHNDAYATDQKDSDTSDKQEEDKSTQQQEQGESQDQTLEDKYSPQELALLRALDHESKHVCCLGVNDGTGKSPQTQNLTQISMDEKDQFSPDNWIPRSSKLIRRTGKYPLNAEPGLNNLYDAGLITPTELYYVRNHGAVPRLLWEFHKLHVEYDGRGKTCSTTDLASFDIINIPIQRYCDAECRLTRPDWGYVEDDNMSGF